MAGTVSVVMLAYPDVLSMCILSEEQIYLV